VDPTLIAWIAAVVLVIVVARAMFGRGRETSVRADSRRNATDVGPEVLAAESSIHHHHKHDHHQGGDHHDSASAGHTAHLGHDAGGHSGVDGGYSGFDGHGGFDGGGFDGGSH